MSETQWYEGTADAVYQNIDIIEAHGVEHIIILAGDHVYKMDYEIMLQQHVRSGADVTVGCLEVPRLEATGFGVMHVDATGRIISFLEKPADPPGMPDKPEMALASMGIYVFSTGVLFDQLRRDAAEPGSSRDFGKDLIPYLVQHGKAVAHRFPDSCVKSSRTGGLADTVIDTNHAALAMGVATGFQVAPVTVQALGFALARAQALFADATAWRAVQQAAMRQHVGRQVSAERYAALYRRLAASNRPIP